MFAPTAAPLGSTRVWFDGLILSLVAGWLVALVFGTVYNWTIARHAPEPIRK